MKGFSDTSVAATEAAETSLDGTSLQVVLPFRWSRTPWNQQSTPLIAEHDRQKGGVVSGFQTTRRSSVVTIIPSVVR